MDTLGAKYNTGVSVTTVEILRYDPLSQMSQIQSHVYTTYGILCVCQLSISN